ncbi:MAG: hypothetical protein VKJ87_05545 [Synechococcus sp.]|nr:hypothetical protein [Synechococcus sp.]
MAEPITNAADPEFQAWARQHAKEGVHHAAELAQITTHSDGEGDPAGDSKELQQSWAEDHAHEQRLHDSRIAMERHD